MRSATTSARAWILVTVACALVLSVPSAGAATARQASPFAALPGISAARAWVDAGLHASSLTSTELSQLASESTSEFSGDHCAKYPGGPSTALACSFGDTSARESVVLYGDSYALEWIPALAQLGTAHHFKVIAYIRYGCPFADVAITDWLGSEDRGCLPFRANVVSAINALRPAPLAVLVSEQYRPVGLHGVWGSISVSTWVKAVQTTVRQIHVDAPVIEVMGVPSASADPPTCLSAHPHAIQVCSTSATAAYAADASKEDPTITTGLHQVHAYALNVSLLMCDGTCPDTADNDLVHSDNWHVSARFASSESVPIGSLLGCVGEQLTAPLLAASGALFRGLLPTLSKASVRTACALAATPPYAL